MEINEVKSDEGIVACWPATLVVYPNLNYKDYLEKMRQQLKEGYRLFYIQDAQDKTRATSILGFRSFDLLFSGKTLCVDFLSTVPEAKGKGHAGALLDWAIQYAKDNEYDAISSDSEYKWNDSHRLFLNHGFKLSSHHFIQSNIQQNK